VLCNTILRTSRNPRDARTVTIAITASRKYRSIKAPSGMKAPAEIWVRPVYARIEDVDVYGRLPGCIVIKHVVRRTTPLVNASNAPPWRVVSLVLVDSYVRYKSRNAFISRKQSHLNAVKLNSESGKYPSVPMNDLPFNLRGQFVDRPFDLTASEGRGQDNDVPIVKRMYDLAC
jgi:hypothetical protein